MTMKKSVTIIDVAREAGFSKTTVGYVLSGQSKKRGVAKKTAQKIRDAAKKLGYIPNHQARSLQGRSTKMISLLFASLQLDWAETVLTGIERILSQQDYHSVIIRHSWAFLKNMTDNGDTGKKAMGILHRRDEGVICQPSPKLKQDYVMLQDASLPIVFIGSTFSDMSGLEKVSSVTWDWYPAAEEAVKYLIKTGHKKIGFVGADHGIKSDITCFNAYKDTLKDAGFEMDQRRILWGGRYSPPTVDQYKELINSSARPDAFFVINDPLAINTLDVFKDMGIKVPDDIAVISMGNLPISSLKQIGLTAVNEPLEEIGAESAKLLLELINGPASKAIHKKISGKKIEVRATA